MSGEQPGGGSAAAPNWVTAHWNPKFRPSELIHYNSPQTAYSMTAILELDATTPEATIASGVAIFNNINLDGNATEKIVGPHASIFNNGKVDTNISKGHVSRPVSIFDNFNLDDTTIGDLRPTMSPNKGKGKQGADVPFTVEPQGHELRIDDAAPILTHSKGKGRADDAPVPTQSKGKGQTGDDSIIIRVVQRDRPDNDDLHKAFQLLPVKDMDTYDVVARILEEERPIPKYTRFKETLPEPEELVEEYEDFWAIIKEAESKPMVLGRECMDDNYQCCERAPVEGLPVPDVLLSAAPPPAGASNSVDMSSTQGSSAEASSSVGVSTSTEASSSADSFDLPSSSVKDEEWTADDWSPDSTIEWTVDGGPLGPFEGECLRKARERRVTRMELGLHQDFKVSKKLLTTTPGAEFFDILLNGPFAEGQDHSHPIMIYSQDIFCMKIVFLSIHNADFEGTFDCPLDKIYEVLSTFDSLTMELSIGSTWFDHWYAWRLGHVPLIPPQSRELLAPAFHFDAARSFARLTRYIVYYHDTYAQQGYQRTRPITNERLELPARIMQQLDFARGRVRNQIVKGLEYPMFMLLTYAWSPARKLTGAASHVYLPDHRGNDANCIYKSQTVGCYVEALIQHGVFPVHEATQRMSISEILQKLRTFRMPALAGCRTCARMLEDMVHLLASHAHRYFDGLCIDCMEKDHAIHPFVEDLNLRDIWVRPTKRIRKLQAKVRTHNDCSLECSFEHGNASWYYSYMCREDAQYRRLANSTLRRKFRRQKTAATLSAFPPQQPTGSTQPGPSSAQQASFSTQQATSSTQQATASAQLGLSSAQQP
ncbi:hypothetical protein P152DRAFT_473745 [Eremomyces bilateralis CBS 781.70]|uniref:Uncharacterized protein n=1 Tax=Eremomyces bilateralis CBS 781.70 TaxID=1392243 RepID=A0A6G1G3W4_9PEZI|nr:uncharacterized protein P152DRAFT_473745 [Eremomyces bilateralis CBS 781.70]KAF1812596.1 hypothetical protein P152DRAFT_473745 [Eremomyces bilateralis CBS 781.70]